jgi:hypothetical protein
MTKFLIPRPAPQTDRPTPAAAAVYSAFVSSAHVSKGARK